MTAADPTHASPREQGPVGTLVAALREAFSGGLDGRQRVVFSAVVMMGVQLAVRAWAAFGGWFYVDDFKFLSETHRPLSLSLIFSPHDDKLMPGGLLIAWVVSHLGAFAWPAAAVSLIVMQLLATLAAWFMLTSLFGVRWGVLVPLGVYLFAPITLTAFMWWGAAINLVPMQMTMFLAVGCHVRYLETRRLRWVVLTTLSVALGLFFYQKALLVYPVLVFLTVVHFAQGRWFVRPWDAVRRWWPGWVPLAVLLAAYLGYTTWKVDSPVSTKGHIDYLGIVGDLLGQTFLTTVLGGPVRWSQAVLPAAQVDPPLVVVVLAALVVVGVVAYGLLRRSGTWTAWLLLVLYLLVDAGLLATGRGSTAGVLAAVEARYVSDAAPVVALALGLAFLPLRPHGARSSAPREVPLLTTALPWKAGAAGLVVLALAAAWSTVTYVGFWHDDFAARHYVQTVQHETRTSGDLDVLDAEVPGDVLLGGLYPYTLPSSFFNRSPKVHAHSSGTDLQMLDDGGVPRTPVVQGGITTPAPAENSCGHLYDATAKKDADGVTIRMPQTVPGYAPWVTIGYLATKDTTVTLTAGALHRSMPVLRGPHTFYVRPDGSFASVHLTELGSGTTLCVSSVKAGPLTTSGTS